MHAETATTFSVTTLRLRRAEDSDLPFIRESALDWKLDDSALELDQFLIAAGPDGVTLGFGRVLAHEGFSEIATLGVVPEARGSGLGRLLVEALIAGCGSDEVWVVTDLPAWFMELGFRVMPKGPPDLQKKLRLCAVEKGHRSARMMHLRKYNPFLNGNGTH
jgi:N-acetylglutamate synthase-like GNAT family acetyltransferase